ncbi:MAG: tetratricopeptide repeat protein [Candidatus Krumholzibacteria bacterium]
MPQRSSADRFYLYTLLVLSAIGLCLQVASLGPLRNSFWGFHLQAFLHPAVAVVGWVLLVLAAVVLVRPARAVEAPGAEANVLARHPLVSAVGLALLCVGVFWVLRSQQLFLGDALPLKIDLARGKDFHPRQPLTMWLQQALYSRLGFLFRSEGVGNEDVAQRTVALGSVISGFFFVLVAAALGRLFVRKTSHGPAVSWLVTLVLLSQGFVQLFFGYVENYTFYALAITVYLWLSLRFMEGLSPLLMPGVVLILALTLHLSAAVLLPSFLVLSTWALVVRRTRRAALRDLVVCAVVLSAVHLVFLGLREYNLLSTLFDVSGRALGGRGVGIPNYMFSSMHFRDFFNEQFLIGPLGLLAFLPAALIAIRRTDRGSLPTVFFLTTGLTYFAASWMAGDSNLGYARNWDLLAPAGVCFTAGALYFLIKHVSEPVSAARLLKFGLVFSIVSLVPWVWVNHNEDLSFERLKALPLGLGRTEVVVANWYLEHDQRGEAATWFRQALKVNPNNGPAYAFLGMLSTEQGQFEEARKLYERAIALRPDKPEYRQNYVLTLMQLKRTEEALPHLDWLVRKVPDNVLYWRLSADALTQLGRAEELVQVYERLLWFAEKRLESDPGNEDASIEAGILLVHLEREEEALERFRRALDANPNSLAGLFNMGSTLVHMGRNTQAQAALQRFVRLYPDHPNAAWARQYIEP